MLNFKCFNRCKPQLRQSLLKPLYEEHLVNSDNSLPLLESGNKQYPPSKRLYHKSEYNLGSYRTKH